MVLSLVWPRSSWEAIIGVISNTFGVLVTFPYTSKGDGNLAYWADGMFANSIQIREAYRAEKAEAPFKLEERALPGRPPEFAHSNLSEYYNFHATMKRIIMGTFNRVIYSLKDIRTTVTQIKLLKRIFVSEISGFFIGEHFRGCVKVLRRLI